MILHAKDFLVGEDSLTTVPPGKGSFNYGPLLNHLVVRKLGISISGLTRAGVDDALTTAEIQDLLADMPSWLSQERHSLAVVREEEERVRERDAERAARREAESR